jgi:ADP-ribosylglycohydrolase
MCLSIVENGGRISPNEWSRTIVEHMNADKSPLLADRLFTTERLAYEKLRSGMNPWEVGRATIPCGNAVMAIEPIGIINAGQPRQAYSDAFLVASVTQDGDDRDAAATIAAGVAAALTPNATVESVISTMETNASDNVRRSIAFAREFAGNATSVDEFADQFYAKLLDWKAVLPPTWVGPAWLGWSTDRYISASSLEILPAAVGIMLLRANDPNEAIIDAANFGRDCDTIGGVVGALMGSIFGASGLKQDWIDDCEEANKNLFAAVDGDPNANFARMADRMIGALHQEVSRLHEYSGRYRALAEPPS